ncbi:hypothetical protein AM587_10000448 [Phytophthora nicotianae]|uniref:Uncharacterized protein n=1 Tax=Phytophthora nicotianae TaxID=4792 RepID=A0A0W8CMB3_PHYNI|nr:hypothetical protein AM587_10014303 [Phytophthora nicotianae]KUF85174.1 hypothetical protein AM587_10000448 [Phytophthora nicotianae]
MPPKKKAKGKKSKASSGGGDAADTAVEVASMFDNAPPIVIEADPVHYVTLDMRQQIQMQHGPIMDLKICRGHFSEANELRHDMMTLAEYGIEGAPEGEPEVVCLIHYDFKPEQHDNPLLLATEKN